MTIAIVSLQCKIILILNEVSGKIGVSWTLLRQQQQDDDDGGDENYTDMSVVTPQLLWKSVRGRVFPAPRWQTEFESEPVRISSIPHGEPLRCLQAFYLQGSLLIVWVIFLMQSLSGWEARRGCGGRGRASSPLQFWQACGRGTWPGGGGRGRRSRQGSSRPSWDGKPRRTDRGTQLWHLSPYQIGEGSSWTW